MSSIRVLAFTGLYPSPARPGHGIFIEHRLSHLGATGALDLRVVVPTQWFPFRHAVFGRYGRLAQVPRAAAGRLQAVYPRHLAIPRVGSTLSPALIALGALGAIERFRRCGFDPDVLDAYYLYPYGVAAVILGRILNKPVILTGLGSDISLLADQPMTGRMIRWATREAALTTVVCSALEQRLVSMGVPSSKVCVVPHGVDLELFKPARDRAALRRELSMQGPTLISVGTLDENKGHHLAVEALAQLPEARLFIVGEGPARKRLEQMIHRRGLAGRIVMTGHVDQAALARLLAAADGLVNCSAREGIANVLLEAMACGTPVAATPVWGSPEVVDDPAAGLLFKARTVDAIAEGLSALLSAPPPRDAVRRHAERYSWQSTSSAHSALLHQVVRQAGWTEPAHSSASAFAAEHMA